MATNFRDLVANVENLGALAPVLSAISGPVIPKGLRGLIVGISTFLGQNCCKIKTKHLITQDIKTFSKEKRDHDQFIFK